VTLPEKKLPTPSEFERQLAAFINSTLLGGKATVDRDTRLFEDGYMNSLRILDLIAVVEKTLGQRIPDRAVRLANFRTIATIVAAFHPDASATAVTATPSDEPPVFARRSDRTKFVSPVDALIARGALQLTGPGQIALAGVALDVLDAVDRVVVRWARELGATEHRYPSMISTAVLARAGRVENVTQVSPGETTALAPAVCYHAYPAWQSKTIGSEPVLLTAVGRCYRHENGDYAPLSRLWDFTMREIIVLGTREQVETHRRALMTRVSELVTLLELDATIETATDPFFAAGDEGRRLMQQAGALKHELKLAVDPSGSGIAAASFNHHYDYFGSRFVISLTNGAPAHSGCVAFGLERWVLALLAQHGIDEQAWPAPVRALVADNGVRA
jgi:seryl-tRNA synthetase/acyl carrier protein